VEHFHDEAGCEQPRDLFTDGFSPVFGEAAERLLHRLGSGPDV
jgi:hypothetical protein